MIVLVINTGSSTIKYSVVDTRQNAELDSGLLEGLNPCRASLQTALNQIQQSIQRLASRDPALTLAGVGHRIVHGGDYFRDSVVVTPEVRERLERCRELAPLHLPGNLLGLDLALDLWPAIPHVAVFDTAFHQTIPEVAYRYAIPVEIADDLKIRRYGFHGISHQSVADQTRDYLEADELALVSLHLGGGASAAAIQSGRSIDTTMGMTPLEGLVMGTRSGDLDPTIPLYLARRLKLEITEVEHLLNTRSGLYGLANESDMRELTRRFGEGDRQAALAIEIFCYRIKKSIGAFLAVLGRLDVIAFTGGIGENSPLVRERALAGLEGLGILLDPTRNGAGEGLRAIENPSSAVKILVVPTQEDWLIARQVSARLTDG